MAKVRHLTVDGTTPYCARSGQRSFLFAESPEQLLSTEACRDCRRAYRNLQFEAFVQLVALGTPDALRLARYHVSPRTNLAGEEEPGIAQSAVLTAEKLDQDIERAKKVREDFETLKLRVEEAITKLRSSEAA